MLAVVLILQYFLPLGLGSCCSSPVYEVFQILLIHCCLHEYYRILLFSSNLSLSLFLKILNIYLLCMCMNVYWHMRAWSPQYVCGGHFQSVHSFHLMDAEDGWTQVNRHLHHELPHWPFCTYLLCCTCEFIEDLCTFYSFFCFLFVLVYVISLAFSVWPSQVYTKSHTVY